MRRAYGVALACGLAAASPTYAQPPPAEEPVRVERAAIAAIMQSERSRGYDLTASSNAVRLQVAVILQLARAARERAPDGAPLLLGHDEYFQAFLDTAGLSAAQAPLFARVAHDHHEDLLVEYRTDRVVRRAGGTPPSLAATVCGGWPASQPARYVYEDRTSTPHIRSMHERVSSYRLLELDGLIVLDEIRGIGGRATSGALGVVFNILGDARATQSRMRVTPDGLLLVRATARKGPLSASRVVTVTPDGRTTQGVPPGRPDLKDLQKRLAASIDVDYVPFVCRPGDSLATGSLESHAAAVAWHSVADTARKHPGP
ncbi:MAG TPA: hypothetical protein VJ011_04665 [Steroidobacteraceae bacterium]|nr:hypothetical protein [Steroidobacteraceae bacterium]